MTNQMSQKRSKHLSTLITLGLTLSEAEDLIAACEENHRPEEPVAQVEPVKIAETVAQVEPVKIAETFSKENWAAIVKKKFGKSLEEFNAENEKSRIENEKLRDELQKKYPNALITPMDVNQFKKVQKQEKICAKCSGYPCKLGTEGNRTVIGRDRWGNPCFGTKSCITYNLDYRVRTAGVSLRYAHKTFENYTVDADNANAVKAAKILLSDNPSVESLYIFGAAGTGKTFLASIIAQEYIKRGKSVKLVNVPRLLDEMRATFDDYSKVNLDTLMLNLQKKDVLILDDLGAENPTEWAVERLFAVIDDRYEHNKTLVVTSNYALPQLAQRLDNPKQKNDDLGITGSRIASRLKGMCGVAQITGKDRRIRGK